ENKVVQKLSEICMFNFCGKVTKAIVATKYTTFVIPKYKRAYEAFIQDYDCNDVAIDQINRNTFYQFVIKSEKGELP
ncbi:HNH endonuclease, partial [Enterococcus faecalis]|nr:HNH endonuclease [Enterococcus faecalis]